MKARIHVRLKSGILDPQGKTVQNALENLGLSGIDEVRMGKLVEVSFKDGSRQQVEERCREACTKLLANPVIEDFEIEVQDG